MNILNEERLKNQDIEAIEIEDCDKISCMPAVTAFYCRTFYELQKKMSYLRQKSILINFSSHMMRYVFTSKVTHLKTTGR